MTTITIPKELAQKGELVLIPREEYEALLKTQKMPRVVNLSPVEKRALEQGRKEIANGQYYTLAEIKHELANHRRQKR